MATRTMVLVQDDLDGSEGAQTISFGLEGKHYDIDLKPEHEEQLRQALSPFLAKARKVRHNQDARSQGRAAGAATPTDRAQTAAIRRWATEQGMEVPARGRIPRHIREAYDNAGR